MNVKQLLTAIEYLNLKGDDEIKLLSSDGIEIFAMPEIQNNQLIIKADTIGNVDCECDCGNINCHYCG